MSRSVTVTRSAKVWRQARRRLHQRRSQTWLWRWRCGLLRRLEGWGPWSWLHIIVPSPALHERGATDSFLHTLVSHQKAGAIINKMWDLASPSQMNRAATSVGVATFVRKETESEKKRTRLGTL